MTPPAGFGDRAGRAAPGGARLPSRRPAPGGSAPPERGKRGRDTTAEWLRVSRTEWRRVETIRVRRLLV
ncbi:hypothetical protein ACF1A5_04840 [Streptomyces sp. NPDC014864]|uniref:hypothetical protein n=1 Tax=Streptomyces sp. NPDC014864 TaxID=3364924 RepID=UPI0036F72D4A